MASLDAPAPVPAAAAAQAPYPEEMFDKAAALFRIMSAPMRLRIISALLSRQGYAVQTAASGEDALRQLDRLTRSPRRWTAWLARGAAGLAILFAIWFLFFLPVEGDRLALPTSNGAGWDEPVAPVARAPLPHPNRAEWPPPARVDDPAANSVSPARGEAAGRLDR